MEETNTSTSLRDEVKKLNENFSKLVDTNKTKLIKPKRLSRSEKKKGYVRYIYLGENKSIKVIKAQIEEGTALVEGIPRIATPDYILSWDNEPTIIQPGWSTEPFSPKQNYEDTVQKQMTAAGHKLLLNRLESGILKPKKKMSGVIIFIIIIALIIGGYFLLT